MSDVNWFWSGWATKNKARRKINEEKLENNNIISRGIVSHFFPLYVDLDIESDAVCSESFKNYVNLCVVLPWAAVESLFISSLLICSIPNLQFNLIRYVFVNIYTSMTSSLWYCARNCQTTPMGLYKSKYVYRKKYEKKKYLLSSQRSVCFQLRSDKVEIRLPLCSVLFVWSRTKFIFSCALCQLSLLANRKQLFILWLIYSWNGVSCETRTMKNLIL